MTKIKRKGHTMTITLFVFLFTVGSVFASLLTQAIKKGFPETSSNLLALMVAFAVGVIGTMCAYILLEVPFTLQNDICVFFMAICIWLGAMLGYDKILQTTKQIKAGGWWQ